MNIKTAKFIGRKLRPVELAMFAKWILRIERKIVKFDDGRQYSVDPISDLGIKLVEDGFYEPEMTHTLNSLLEEGDTFVDLGSNEGYFSILASKLCGQKGGIFAIEPQCRLWNVILNNVSLNKCTNVQIVPFGVGSSSSELTMNLYPTLNSGASSFAENFSFKISFEKIRRKIYGQQAVRIIKLDDLEETFPNAIKLIKIDIEGFEFEALKGASKLLQKKVFKHLLIETHAHALESMNQSIEEMNSFLLNHGYSKEVVTYNLNLYSAK
ncbi:MAG: FkbM family methyltransferase [Patiriisocius sp.]|jgi:FkbM family methyltransferase